MKKERIFVISSDRFSRFHAFDLFELENYTKIAGFPYDNLPVHRPVISQMNVETYEKKYNI